VDKLSKLLMMILMTLPITCLEKMLIVRILMILLILLTHPPTQQHHRQSFSNSSSGPVTLISLISPIHLSISEIMGRMKILSGKNLKLLFKTEMAGNVRLGPDGKPLIVIAPPPSDLCGRVFLTKPDERGEVKRAQVVELIKARSR
jgi:hypothetical protein